jgi:hypothetical protein
MLIKQRRNVMEATIVRVMKVRSATATRTPLRGRGESENALVRERSSRSLALTVVASSSRSVRRATSLRFFIVILHCFFFGP